MAESDPNDPARSLFSGFTMAPLSDTMKIPRLYVWVFLALVLASLIGFSLFVAHAPDEVKHPETGFNFPLPANIIAISAIDVIDRDGSTKHSFDIPTNCWETVLGALSPSEQDYEVGAMSVVGTLKIQSVTGEQVFLFLYGWRYNLWFSVGHTPSTGPYYHGASLSRLECVLDAAYDESKK